MSQQQEQQAKTVVSLIEDVKREASYISPQSPTCREEALVLIQGDLRLAKQQAGVLFGEGADLLQAICLFTEAQLKIRFAGSVKNRQFRGDLTEASQLLEKAIGLSGTPQMHSLLGTVYTEQGRFAEARKALTIAAESDQGEIATEARKNLLRLSDTEIEAKNYLLRFFKYAEKHTQSTVDFIAAVVCIVINIFYPFALLPLLAFVLVCAGIYQLFKETFGKK
jgi:tetratricopeptide (TPR) repeat protein